MREHCTAIILAAGRGSRMGMATAKQYLELEGKSVFMRSLEVFQNSDLIDGVILAADEEHVESCRQELRRGGFAKVLAVCAGGKERYESVWRALEAMKRAGREDGYVFIHDAARPFVTQDILYRAYEGARRWKACVVGMPVKDTIKLVNEDGEIAASPARQLVWQAQTPQVFWAPLLRSAFEKQMGEDCSGITDDAMVVERQTGVRAHMVRGSYENIKITTPEDLEVAALFCRREQPYENRYRNDNKK